MTNLPRPCLMLVTEPSPRLTEIITAAVKGGVDVVQWREKAANRAKYRQRFHAIHSAAGEASVIVNGNLEAALACGARRIHLPEKSLPLGVIRWRIGAGGLIGKSVHSVEGAQRAQADGADYIIAGTIFASSSHPDIEPMGLDFLREVCASVTVPVLAIGGGTPESIGDCVKAGASGAAVLSPMMRAENPTATAQAYRLALETAWEERKCS